MSILYCQKPLKLYQICNVLQNQIPTGCIVKNQMESKTSHQKSNILVINKSLASNVLRIHQKAPGGAYNGVSDLRQPLIFSLACINWTEYIAQMNLCQPYFHIVLQVPQPTLCQLENLC